MLKSHNNGINKNLIANCTTAADQQIKVATLTDSIGSGWLQPGVVVFVKFTNTNTYSSTTANPCKLNVNNTGAKNIYYENSATPTGTNTVAFGIANYIHQYIYDGTNWVQMGYSKEQGGDATYESKEASSGGTDLSLVTTGEKYIWNNKANGDHNHDSRYYTESEIDTKLSKTEVLISDSDDAYKPTQPYSVGDYVIHDDKLYKCTTACSAGSWATNQSCFTADTLTGAINRNVTAIQTKANSSDLTWKFHVAQRGTSLITLPTSWNELWIQVVFGGNELVAVEYHIINHQDTGEHLYMSGSATPSDTHSVFLRHTPSINKVMLESWTFRGTDVSSTSVVRIYYR